MTEPTVSIRTDATRTLLQQLDAVLIQWRRLPFLEAWHGTALEQMSREIDRARRQFDSKLFFVVVFGPLKAGKSTLTNALAGECVSPAGFGKETARRASLVVQGTESAVEQYFSTEPEVNHFLSQHRWGAHRDHRGFTPPGHSGSNRSTHQGEQLRTRVPSACGLPWCCRAHRLSWQLPGKR